MSQDQAEYIVQRAKVENAALKKYAAIQKAAEDKIGVQKIYIDMTGDIEAAFILDEIIFFTLPRGEGRSALRVWKDGYLWLAVQRADWWERKRLKPRQADTAIEKLEALNLIVKSVHKFNGQTSHHLRLNIPEFFRQYGEVLEKSNPAEDENDTITRDIQDLYAMMGELQNGESQIRELQNGETESRIRETESRIRDSINIPHTSLTHPSIPLSIENAIATGQPITADMVEKSTLREEAPRMFERALGFSKPLPWWSGREWTAFAQWVCDRHAENRLAFGEYNIWRATPYTKGGMSNNRIRGFPAEFYDSWDMFMMSKNKSVEKNTPVRMDENGIPESY